jgi:hypothetical protein
MISIFGLADHGGLPAFRGVAGGLVLAGDHWIEAEFFVIVAVDDIDRRGLGAKARADVGAQPRLVPGGPKDFRGRCRVTRKEDWPRCALGLRRLVTKKAHGEPTRARCVASTICGKRIGVRPERSTPEALDGVDITGAGQGPELT